MNKLLEVNNLKISFSTNKEILTAVDNITFDINKGETLCIVGESGSGKSITSLSIMGLLEGSNQEGKILFEGSNLLEKPETKMRKIRGKEIAMIFQEPMTSLNPLLTVGYQISEALILHQGMKRKEAFETAKEVLKKVGVSDPERRIHEYPHQMSGGMRQRIMIALALCCNPKLLIADEPTTALDVTIQAQILELMKQLKKDLGMTILMITHDLCVVAEMADRVIVMYAGKVMEKASVVELFNSPKHPYTEGLLSCIPKIDQPRGKLYTISGTIPSPKNFPTGCRFQNRCPYVQGICTEEEPELKPYNSHQVACHFTPEERNKYQGSDKFGHGILCQ